jgi:uracil-DNA glycosylase
MNRHLELLDAIRRCDRCAAVLPQPPRPILQWHPAARLLIAGQAPGRVAQASGIPFDDVSGERLRDWLGLDRATFYDPEQVAILPMGFCFPGSGRNGDLPPRPECADAWRERCLAQLPRRRLTLAIGRHAQRWHLPGTARPLTEVVRDWRAYGPGLLPLPHPSPRNALWLRRNPWFESELLPELRRRVAAVLAAGD